VVNPASGAPPIVTYFYPAGAQRGTTTEITAAGTFDTWPVKVWTSGKGVSVEPGKDKGKLTVTVAADAVPGTYWLRAYNDDGASALRPFIVGTLPEVMEKEPNDEFAKPQVIDKNAVVNARLERPGDVDCFAVALTKGQTLVASLEAHRTLRSPMDGVLQLLSADGFVLDQNNDFHGLDPQLAFTAPKDGTYVVRVFAFPATPDSSIRFAGAENYVYRLTLTTGPFADFPVPLAFGSLGPNKLSEMKGWNIPPGMTQFRMTEPADTDSHITLFHPDVANPLRMRFEWRVRCATIGIDDEDVNKGYVAPFSVTGRIDRAKGAAEQLFSCANRQPLTIQAESRTIGLAVNPVVEIIDKDGKRLARADPGKLNGDTTLSFTPPAVGELYRVVVRDLYGGGGGPRDYFLLRVLTPTPDYELTVAADRFATPPGNSVDIPVKITRKDGFKNPVEVTAEGLPEGVKFEVKPPAGKPDPNTVTLTLTAEKPASGPFRLVGHGHDKDGPPEFTRTARAALPEFDVTTADLWVTVSNSPVQTPQKKVKK
jgi:hypothetical protein